MDILLTLVASVLLIIGFFVICQSSDDDEDDHRTPEGSTDNRVVNVRQLRVVRCVGKHVAHELVGVEACGVSASVLV